MAFLTDYGIRRPCQPMPASFLSQPSPRDCGSRFLSRCGPLILAGGQGRSSRGRSVRPGRLPQRSTALGSVRRLIPSANVRERCAIGHDTPLSCGSGSYSRWSASICRRRWPPRPASPLPMLDGTCTLIWTSPAPTTPAKSTAAGCPPMVTVTAFASRLAPETLARQGRLDSRDQIQCPTE